MTVVQSQILWGNMVVLKQRSAGPEMKDLQQRLPRLRVDRNFGPVLPAASKGEAMRKTCGDAISKVGDQMSKFVLTLFGGASNHVAAPGANVQPNSARNNFYAPDICF